MAGIGGAQSGPAPAVPRRVAVLDDFQGAGAAQPSWRRLAGRIQLDGFRDALGDERKLAERLQPYQIIVPIRERTLFTASLLRQLPALEMLALTGRHGRQVDLDAATAGRILVTETQGSGRSAIEVTMALMLAGAYRIPQESLALRGGLWQTGVGSELAGKTLGIVGLGRIGKAVSTLALAFGMRVVAWSPHLTEELAQAAGATYRPMDELFRESDFVSLHLRLSEQTAGIVAARHLALMKPTAWLINTARGQLLDEPALVAALRKGRLGGAALDVFQAEPLPVDHPLRSMDNVVLSPHIGSATVEAYEIFFSGVVDNIAAYLDGRVPRGALNAQVLGPVSHPAER